MKIVKLVVVMLLTLLIVLSSCAPAAPAMQRRVINMPGGKIEVNFDPDQFSLPEDVILKWVENSAQAITDYWNGFPVPLVRVTLRPSWSGGVSYGTTRQGYPPTITITVGRNVTERQLNNDWVMTHEMTHLGFPSINGDYAWIEEGMATYIEPLVRTRMGLMTPEQMWADLIDNMPQAINIYGSNGMEDASGFTQIYWGGALFWLLADVEMRQKSSNRRGLEQVVRGLLADGGDINANWEVSSLLGKSDKFANTPVFKNIYQRMTITPIKVDVEELWQQLGVKRQNNRVVFNDRAPLAHIRRALTAPPARRR